MQHFARHPHGHLPTMRVVDRDGKKRELTREETRAAMLQELQPPCTSAHCNATMLTLLAYSPLQIVFATGAIRLALS